METLPNSNIVPTVVEGLPSAIGPTESLGNSGKSHADVLATPADLHCKRTPLWKRVLDLIIVAALAPILLPVMLLIACHIKWSSKGPVLFCQRRLGYGGKHFTIFKFRTLKPEEYCVTSNHRAYVADLIESDQPAAKPDISKRLIPGGKFLRDASLDELPQLFNVLLGDMSIVGPRPDVLEWEDYKAWQTRRFEVAPGITGLWQVSGKNRLTFDEMIRLDIQYVDTRSLKLDVWILWKTLAVVLGRGNK